MEIRQVFTTPDGATFDSKAEALDHIRIPKIREALMSLTEGNEALVEVLIAQKETVVSAFDVGTLRRVTKAEKKKLAKVFAKIEEAELPGTEYLFETQIHEGREERLADILIESWKWPKVSRLGDDEKAEKAKEILKTLDDLSPEVIDWIIGQKEEILNAYEEGKEKRELPPKAMAGLEEYRRRKAAEKAAAAA
jgi:hypothetical protein